ncbi:unnamed protein product [Calypogeia fissa]
MFPHPDSLRSRYTAKSSTTSEDQQQCLNPVAALPPLTLRIGTPMTGRIGTPRDLGFGTPTTGRLGTPRDVHNLAESREKALERQLLEHGITPIYQPDSWISEGVPNVVEIDLSDVRTFVSCPAPRGCGPIQCYIRRRFRVDWLFPRYELYATDGDQFLLSARKRKKTIRNYIISLDPDDISRKTGNFFGKVQSNFIGTDFWFYDKGARKKPEKSICLKRRGELGAVTDERNVLGLRGPRKLTAVIPALRPEDDKPFAFQQILPKESHSMLIKYRSGHDQSQMLVMHSKKPMWNKELNAYCLNFRGRVTQPSVKNFQLVAETDPEYIVLQFGKVGQDAYNLDYQHPMSALQAFAICLTSLDYKIACE